MTAMSDSFFQPFGHEVTDDPFIAPPQASLANRELQEQLERRIMYRDFAQCGIQPETQLGIEDIFDRLKMSRRNYSNETVRRIYGIISFQSTFGGDFVTGKQFVEAYMKRKKELARVLENSQKELESIEKMLLQSATNLQKLSHPEPRTRATNFEKSKLTTQVVSVQGISDSNCDQTRMYKIHLECQGQAIETRSVYQSSGISYFNEMFSFQIARRDGNLRAILLQTEPYSGNELVIGECSVAVGDLADQRKHELTKQFEVRGSAELLLSCQWIFSKKLLYHEYLREFTLKKEHKLTEMAEYRQEYDKLDLPFLLEDGKSISSAIALGPEYVADFIDQIMQNMNVTNWQIASQYVVTLSFILLCITGFSRSLFLDQIIAGFCFWCILDSRRWVIGRYNFAIFATLCSMGIDLIWMRIYYFAWTLNSVESEMHTISKVMSFFLLPWKVVVVLFFWRGRFEVSKKGLYQDRFSNMLAVSQRAELQEEQLSRIERAEKINTLHQNSPYTASMF